MLKLERILRVRMSIAEEHESFHQSNRQHQKHGHPNTALHCGATSLAQQGAGDPEGWKNHADAQQLAQQQGPDRAET